MNLLRERKSLISHWMKPASRDDIMRTIAALSPVTKRRNSDQQTTGAIVETYVLDLADQPLFALQEACTAFRRIHVGNGFMPLPGELLVETKKKAEWVRVEAFEIDRILTAEIVTETPRVERDGFKDRIEALKASLQSARPKNEIARGYEEPVARTAEGLSAEEMLRKTAETFRANPVKLAPDALVNRFRRSAA